MRKTIDMKETSNFEQMASILEDAFQIRQQYRYHADPELVLDTEESVITALLEQGYDPRQTIDKASRLTQMLRHIIHPPVDQQR